MEEDVFLISHEIRLTALTERGTSSKLRELPALYVVPETPVRRPFNQGIASSFNVEALVRRFNRSALFETTPMHPDLV